MIPESGVTKTYITDAGDGFIYTVTTTVEVLQQTPDSFQLQIDQAQRNVDVAQELAQTATSQLQAFQKAHPAQATLTIQE